MQNVPETKLKIPKKPYPSLPAYTLHLEDSLELKIWPTANGWWKREAKVSLLLAAFKDGYKVSEACKRAGISLRQYKYFRKAHPDIQMIRKYYKQSLLNKARLTVANAIETNEKFALKYLRKVKPEEFPTPSLKHKAEAVESYRQKEREGFLEELRELKIIIARYRELTDDLKLGGWYKTQLKMIDNMVAKYNSTHKRNNERILRHNKTGQPEVRSEPRKNFVMTPEQLLKEYNKANNVI